MNNELILKTGEIVTETFRQSPMEVKTVVALGLTFLFAGGLLVAAGNMMGRTKKVTHNNTTVEFGS